METLFQPPKTDTPISPMAPPQSPAPDPQAAQQGVVTIDAVVELLRNDRMRSYKIEVETDSLVEADQNEAKQRATEFLQAIGQFFQLAMPIVQNMPQAAPMFGALAVNAVRQFRVPSQIEEMIEQTMEKIGMLLQQPKPPPPPSPDEQIKANVAAMKGRAEIQKAQIGAQQAQVEGQAKIAQTVLAHHTAMREAQVDEQRAQADFIRQQQASGPFGDQPDGGGFQNG